VIGRTKEELSNRLDIENEYTRKESTSLTWHYSIFDSIGVDRR
jgi:hypothetical protein